MLILRMVECFTLPVYQEQYDYYMTWSNSTDGVLPMFMLRFQLKITLNPRLSRNGQLDSCT
jgi:hypothetical protein